MGEIGKGLAEVLCCGGIDKNDPIPEAGIIHICFPYAENFVHEVRRYKMNTCARLTIVHATVPVGTVRQCGADVVHSPIRGKHPHLADGIRTFTKFFGGRKSREAATHFSALGIKTVVTGKSENTEAMKLWDTEIYREAILLNKRIKRFCTKHNLDFDIVYTQANKTYNEGYARLGHPEYAKYILKYINGPIGGHCVQQNHRIFTRV